ncbi:lipopolysaccharide biosynthesis protein [Kistimonas asteriae]|uniref:lipopolysaccharide biosynthesis protein n=1 Tax=Kistimonas asteriae TaxID=517724 RepID=UPI001BA99417|nr:oligosaccharide flippase family protein [Kistimonas asteriae]
MISYVKNRILKNSQVSWAIADQTLVSGANFLTGIVLARLLGIESYGVFTLAWLVVLFFNSLQLATIIQPLMSLSPKYEGDKLKEFYGSMLFIQLLWIIIYLLIICIGIFFQNQFESISEISEYIVPVFSVLIAFQIQDFIRRLFFTLSQPTKAFLSDSISYLGRISVFLLLYYFGKLTITNTLYAITFVSLVAIVPSFRIRNSIKLFHSHHLLNFKENFDFSKWLLGSALLQWTTGNYFFVVAGVLLGPIAVGAVKACQNIIGITHILFQAMENFVPSQATRALRKGIKELKNYLLKLVCIGGIGTGLIIIIVVLFSEPLITLVYGEEYLEYSYLMNWFGVLYCLSYLSLPIRAGLRAVEKNSVIFYGYIISTGFSLLSAKPIITSYSELGVIIGSILSQLIIFCVLGVYLLINIARLGKNHT